jgi:hypothetical protein
MEHLLLQEVLLMNGSSSFQTISGTASSTDFNNLVLLNNNGVTSAKN